MAKSTKAQQVSTGTSDSYTDHELSDPVPPIRIQRAMLGVVPTEEVASSVGGASTQSSRNETTSSGKTKASPQAPAQTTENPSGVQAKEADSSAALTGGDGQENLSQLDKTIVKPAPPKSSKEKARATTMDDDDFAALQ